MRYPISRMAPPWQGRRRTALGLKLADKSENHTTTARRRACTLENLTAVERLPSDCWLGAPARESLSSGLLAAT